jgi:phosphohistidine phosphatase SixA
LPNFLRPLKLTVNAIWHSGKPRAQQTGELLAKAIGALDRIVQREGLGPKDEVTATKEALQQTSGDVMIVGHLPFLGKLVALLVTGNEEAEIVEFHSGSIQWGRLIFHLSDVDRFWAYLMEKGFRPHDASWGERYFHMPDPDGHELSFARPL